VPYQKTSGQNQARLRLLQRENKILYLFIRHSSLQKFPNLLMHQGSHPGTFIQRGRKTNRNPFAQFHISPNVKEREFLTEDELKVLMTHEFEASKLAYIRDIRWEMERKDAEHKKEVSRLTRLADTVSNTLPRNISRRFVT